MTNKRKIINDPVYGGFLTIDDEVVFDVISHPFFQRQRRIKQLGLTYLVYPGAVHTRFNHMLGALDLMCRALDVLKTKGVDISDEELLGAKLAILLHDIGHGPFSHTSEHVIADVHHETLTELFMQRLNQDMDGKLNLAISIFNNTYHKHFLHQLVSSQLDMDRLDYLSRDSFFTGVSEGVVGTDRIISMLNVCDDELVVDEKGIYSIEKFIVSRRLMYWQVYMHKTVIAADTLLLGILKRARELKLQLDNPLGTFLDNHFTESDFINNPHLLELFSLIDDDDVMVAIKQWMGHADFVLRTLSSQLVNRQICGVTIANQPFSADLIDSVRDKVQSELNIDYKQSEYFVNTGVLHNHAYDFNDQEIRVLYKNGMCYDISEASDQLDRHFLEKQVTKYYLCYPKQFKKIIPVQF